VLYTARTKGTNDVQFGALDCSVFRSIRRTAELRRISGMENNPNWVIDVEHKGKRRPV